MQYETIDKDGNAVEPDLSKGRVELKEREDGTLYYLYTEYGVEELARIEGAPAELEQQLKRASQTPMALQLAVMSADLPDEQAVQVSMFYPEWEVGCPYKVRDVRRRGDVLYRCIQEHVSTAEWTPEDAVSLWQRILEPDPETGLFPWVQPESTTPYMKGDKVVHKGKIWVSVVDNNIWEPGVYGWDDCTEGGE